MLQTRQQLKSGEETDYGLGWMLDTVELAGERTRLVGHASRTIEGASTSFLTFPERGLVVAVMANISFADIEVDCARYRAGLREAEVTRPRPAMP